MLKNIPKNISPALLKILCEMGHGDEIVIGDGNFPGTSLNNNIIRYDSSNICDILDSILYLFPLDEYVDSPVALMATGSEYIGSPDIWKSYEGILKKHKFSGKISKIDRFDFYDRAKNAFGIIATGEGKIYANIILKKGVVK